MEKPLGGRASVEAVRATLQTLALERAGQKTITFPADE
ncbi:uncharacterized protein HHUB_4164 (plasmid) [Halobacterium hubeiense]|uniref:Uncharacterized protein n=1 Tax=Halobacterium hubeiense TaxID=1407499 RepID=A0A0U5HAZ4_9EURY|nr:uncharacterized protein HHUB_4164 [Halobacterium hubeiense]